MEQWYTLCTPIGKEREAEELLYRAVDRELWSEYGIPRKMKVFRSGGMLHLLEDVMFPGYLFIKTAFSKELCKALQKSREFPQFIGGLKPTIVPVEEKDLKFLQNVCGENLQNVMGISKIVLNHENKIVMADGVLKYYIDRIIKLNLHKRYAVVEVELFNRRQSVLFGLKLERDLAG